MTKLWNNMKKVRRTVKSADHVRGSGGEYWELWFKECDHIGYSGGYTKCPKTSICEKCTRELPENM